METERINRNEWFEPNAGNKKDSFQEHIHSMRMFARSHSHGVSGLETTADEKPPRLENIGGLPLNQPIRDTGGPRRPVSTTKWIPLIPGCRLLKRRVSQN